MPVLKAPEKQEGPTLEDLLLPHKPKPKTEPLPMCQKPPDEEGKNVEK